MTRLEPLSAVLVAAVAMTAVGASEWLRAEEPDRTAAKESKARRGSDLARERRRKQAPLLAALAKEHGYRVEPGKALRRVAPPFPDACFEFYRVSRPGRAGPEPSAMIFEQRDGKLTNKSMTYSGGLGHSVQGLIDGLTGIKSQMIEGGDVREARVQGDWVLRVGATKEEIIEQLTAILRDELSLDVEMEFREIERPVYVARGTYTFTPLEGGRKRRASVRDGRAVVTDPIEIFATKLIPDSGAGGGSGNFDKFLAWLGDWVGDPIVAELDAPPTGRFSWDLHARSPFTDQEYAEDHEPRLVLPNITAQTGLTFTLEQRPVMTLFVEGTK